ncbi:TIGR04282 family arsenosugar biosynthesis glycosyltransferase [Planctomycetota bacterium]
MNEVTDNCVLFFVKYPVQGQVKTRLAAELAEEVVVELYKNFVLDTLSTIRQLNVPFRICFHPGSAGDNVKEWLGERYKYIAQEGSNLGQRMKNALAQAFEEHFSRAILIGSDSPDLPADLFIQALQSLESHHAVIGPSSDGGYYLIGFSKARFLPDAFNDISWSTENVFQQTLDVFEGHSSKVHILPQWFDVDTPVDLNELIVRNRNTVFNNSKTFAYLLQIREREV